MDKPKTHISVHRRTQSVPIALDPRKARSASSTSSNFKANKQTAVIQRRVSFDRAAKSKSIKDRIGVGKGVLNKRPLFNFSKAKQGYTYYVMLYYNLILVIHWHSLK